METQRGSFKGAAPQPPEGDRQAENRPLLTGTHCIWNKPIPQRGQQSNHAIAAVLHNDPAAASPKGIQPKQQQPISQWTLQTHCFVLNADSRMRAAAPGWRTTPPRPPFPTAARPPHAAGRPADRWPVWRPGGYYPPPSESAGCYPEAGVSLEVVFFLVFLFRDAGMRTTVLGTHTHTHTHTHIHSFIPVIFGLYARLLSLSQI